MVNETWAHATNTLPCFTIIGLVPGSTYSFKTGVLGKKSQGADKGVISRLVV